MAPEISTIRQLPRKHFEMTERDREVIIQNGSNLGWLVAAILAALLVVGAYVYRDAIFGGGGAGVNISIDVPDPK